MEITANALQTVAAGGNVLFTDTVTSGNCSIVHRDDSGLVTLRGITNQCRARYKVSFGGNIAIPDGGAVAPISLAIGINGEPVGATTMIVVLYLLMFLLDAAHKLVLLTSALLLSMFKTLI